ncbi:MAG: hypothetical protein AMJ84_01730 [Acidithiobacillales bacterium SM23_46]|jgi:hypothetical protein|nr:MAG: hypothetical protein AMJ84_01730 [Acidithiobacillales bacterium SM23_46]KPL26458.1 MAG: hypothetical protein AMJ72_12685 [Acidithiobacillales bacterium SM1_46]
MRTRQIALHREMRGIGRGEHETSQVEYAELRRVADTLAASRRLTATVDGILSRAICSQVCFPAALSRA